MLCPGRRNLPGLSRQPPPATLQRLSAPMPTTSLKRSNTSRTSFSGAGCGHGFEEAVWQWHPLVIAHFPSGSWGTALCVMSYESRRRSHRHLRQPLETLSLTASTVWASSRSIGTTSLGGNRIAALDHWGYHTRTEAETLLLGPGANVWAAALMHADEGWLPGWRAQQTRCGLTD